LFFVHALTIDKRKRSFVKRFFKYLKVTGNLSKAQKAFNISGIGIAGFLRGIFQ